MKTFEDIYTGPNGPFHISVHMNQILSVENKMIMKAKDCQRIEHRKHRDSDFYYSEDCVSFYSPSAGMFTFNMATFQVISQSE